MKYAMGLLRRVVLVTVGVFVLGSGLAATPAHAAATLPPHASHIVCEDYYNKLNITAYMNSFVRAPNLDQVYWYPVLQWWDGTKWVEWKTQWTSMWWSGGASDLFEQRYTVPITGAPHGYTYRLWSMFYWSSTRTYSSWEFGGQCQLVGF